MAKLKIPDRFRDSFSTLLSLGVPQLDLFEAVVNEAPRGASFSALTESLSSRLDISAAKINDILQALVSLYVLKEQELHPGDLLNDFLEAAQAENLINSAVDISAIREKVAGILNANATLGLRAKAISLSGEYPRVYVSSRVMTDVRPAFDQALNDDWMLGDVIIVHQLRFLYHSEDGRHKEFYISLDRRDLEELSKNIERATKKETLLRKNLHDKHIETIELDKLHP